MVVVVGCWFCALVCLRWFDGCSVLLNSVGLILVLFVGCYGVVGLVVAIVMCWWFCLLRCLWAGLCWCLAVLVVVVIVGYLCLLGFLLCLLWFRLCLCVYCMRCFVLC